MLLQAAAYKIINACLHFIAILAITTVGLKEGKEKYLFKHILLIPLINKRENTIKYVILI